MWACSPARDITLNTNTSSSGKEIDQDQTRSKQHTLHNTNTQNNANTHSPSNSHGQHQIQHAHQHGRQTSHQLYGCVWRHLRDFNTSVTYDNNSSTSANKSPGKGNSSNLVGIFPSQPDGHSSPVFSQSVSVLSSGEGSGLMSAGTMDGDVVVWEVYEKGKGVEKGTEKGERGTEKGTALGYVEYIAKKSAIEIMRDGIHSAGSGSSTATPQLSPEETIKELILSWDDDEEDEDEEEEEEEEEEEDDIRGSTSASVHKPVQLNINLNSPHHVKSDKPKHKHSEKKSIKDEISKNDESLYQTISFQPDDIRERFRIKVPGSITAQLLIPEILFIVVGTSIGKKIFFVLLYLFLFVFSI